MPPWIKTGKMKSFLCDDFSMSCWRNPSLAVFVLALIGVNGPAGAELAREGFPQLAQWGQLPPDQRREIRQQMREHWQQMPQEERQERRERFREERRERHEAFRQMPQEDRSRMREELRGRREAWEGGRPPHGDGHGHGRR